MYQLCRLLDYDTHLFGGYSFDAFTSGQPGVQLLAALTAEHASEPGPQRGILDGEDLPNRA